MKIKNKHYHTIWVKPTDSRVVQAIDQRKIPFSFEIFEMRTVDDTCFAISEMVVRGAPLIGIAAAFGMYLTVLNFDGKDFENYIVRNAEKLKATRPTAVNLAYAVDQISSFILKNKNCNNLSAMVLGEVEAMKMLEVAYSEKIGEFGLTLIEAIFAKTKKTVNILTHCNAGWLACIEWGTATAPIYKAHLKGIPVHVWVDETRPRNQGARLTAFELGEEGIPYTVIPDNTGGHLMQHGMVDLVFVGSDRTTANGDVANKIGTYLKALAAFDNNIPFYVALPSSTFDFTMNNGICEIPIEQRNAKEIIEMEGIADGKMQTVRILSENSPVANYGFDVTPARLITGLITERGICKANKESIMELFA